MNNYYDLYLDFKESNPYKFYEWELNDNLISIKKIPLFRVNEQMIINLYKYNAFISESFLLKIKNRTTYKEDNKIKTIKYSCIFTDTKFSIALIFNEKGKVIKRSHLMIEDELNVNELAYSLKKEKIVINKMDSIMINNSFRQEEQMKRRIKDEIKRVMVSKKYDLLIYYYLEWFNEYSNDPNFIYSRMLGELNKDNVFNLDKMYDLVLQLTN